MKLIVYENHVPLREVLVETTDIDEVYEIYVGRSDDCHVQIDDPLISRHHFVLKNQSSNWYCEKLTQLGAITVNGTLLTKNIIKSGDEIKCGSYSIIISEFSSAPVAAVLVAPIYQMENNITQKMEPELSLNPIKVPAPEKDELELLGDDFNNEPRESIGELTSDNVEEDNSLKDDESITFGEDPISNDAGFSGDSTAQEDFGELVDNSQNESTRFFKAFVNYQLVLFGEHAPYDRFQIDQDEIFIGRDIKKCQIILNDPEVSSVHAVIRKNLSEVSLEDLNSSNGTILNAERINKAQLNAGDEFVIGGTSFTLEVRSDLLESESDRLMPVEADQSIETEEIEDEIINDDNGDISFSSDAPPEKSLLKRFQKDPQFRKKVIYIGAGLFFLYLFIDSDTEEPKVAKVPKATQASQKIDKPKLNLSKELENARNVAYELGVSFFEQNRYDIAEQEFQKVVSIDANYKKVQSYLEQTKSGLARLAEIETQRKAEEDRIKTKKIVDELLVKARDAVKEKQVTLAESIFTQIIEKDPENIEVSQLKLELEAWQREEERIALEKATRETARKKMVDSLSPGKTFYLKKEWYRAILKIEEFLRIKGVDEDLIKEGSDMLSDAKNQLASDLGPMLGKARSLKEGQDYKNAYEAFLEILKIEPTNPEALNEVDDIKSQLDGRSKRIYREAIIAESLSLFTDAKEKFQEVQQVSPTDSDYYKKATDKLKNYLE